jgi:hypothetical protein
MYPDLTTRLRGHYARIVASIVVITLAVGCLALAVKHRGEGFPIPQGRSIAQRLDWRVH